MVAALSNGDPLVVERIIGDARRIDLAMSSGFCTDFGRTSWDPTTDGNLIIANSLVYVANVPTPTVIELMESIDYHDSRDQHQEWDSECT